MLRASEAEPRVSVYKLKPQHEVLLPAFLLLTAVRFDLDDRCPFEVHLASPIHLIPRTAHDKATYIVSWRERPTMLSEYDHKVTPTWRAHFGYACVGR